MENLQKPTKQVALNYGLILGVLGIIQGLTFYAIGNAYGNEWYKAVISIAITIVVIVLGIKEYKKRNNGFLTLGQGLKTGVGIALIASIISAIYIFIFAKFIEPDFVENIIEIQRQKFMENPNMSEEMMDNIGENTRKYFYLFTIGYIFIASIFIGFVVSLIASLVMKRTEELH
ncbi:DUF4199 domain-containing protein [Aureibaculum sp. 2210JD6-5]|uniref:DUF4199 domain-containing protein n=1 Tax=Aureibaculum sp. 2210JD6-5 TaxID=3103957 RepID=UPI002AAC7DB5|nr:DUF4199 domain-containing protein [Aureibaculum sp. 2210JD6-5]MDY7393719.1 DUF4199 domain-containing protein [Aureibaculum sp. 2210JD6-5]